VRHLTDTARLQIQVDIEVKRLKKSYEKAIQTIAALKKETIEDSERLDAFTDFLILESASAKRRCEGLERECKLQAFKHAKLRDLKTQCNLMEQLAKDLLCYSLGDLRRSGPVAEHTEK